MLYVGIMWIDYLLKLKEMIEKQKMKGTETDRDKSGDTEIIRLSGNKLRFFTI